jgi:hypothetical protein
MAAGPELDEEIAPMAHASRIASNGFPRRHDVPLDLPEESPVLPWRIVPVLPQENPATLQARIAGFLQDMQPRNAVEADLVAQVARLSWEIERSDRLEQAHLAHRVRKAELRAGKASTGQFARAEELGRKLFCDARPGESSGVETPPPSWVDEPAVFLRKLEETEDGCRWLLKHWIEFRNLLKRKVKWFLTDLFRFVRLQGKHGVEAVNDPELNVFFLAWDVIFPGLARAFWEGSRGRTPDRDPGLNAAMEWREIADRPGNEGQAWAILRAEVEQRIEGLSAALGDFARLAAADAADRAALDLSPGLARHRRHRLALGRELLRIMETLRKMSSGKATADGKSRMADGKPQMADGKSRMADGKSQMADGKAMANGQASTHGDGVHVGRSRDCGNGHRAGSFATERPSSVDCQASHTAVQKSSSNGCVGGSGPIGARRNGLGSVRQGERRS